MNSERGNLSEEISKNIKKPSMRFTIMFRTLFVLISFFVMQNIFAQESYIPLLDLSGYDRTDNTELLNAIINLESVVQQINDHYQSQSGDKPNLDLKIYDSGFYLHTDDFENGIDEALQNVNAIAEAGSQHYILLAKESNERKIYSKIHFITKLPDSFNCFIKDEFDASIKDYIDRHSYNSSPSRVLEFQVELINLIANQLQILYVCCDPTASFKDGPGKKYKNSDPFCSGIDLLEEDKIIDAKEYILDYLSCLQSDLQSSTPDLDVVSLGDPLYENIKNLRYDVSPYHDCYLPTGVVQIYKTSSEDAPTEYTVESVHVDEVTYPCGGFSVDQEITYTRYHYGAFVVLVTKDFDLSNHLASRQNSTLEDNLNNVISSLKSGNQLEPDDLEVLAKSIGCYLSRLSFRDKFELLEGLLISYSPTTTNDKILNGIRDFISFEDYSVLLFYIVAAFEDYDDKGIDKGAIPFFTELKVRPHLMRSLMNFSIAKDYKADLKTNILKKYTAAVLRQPSAFSDLVTIPFSVKQNNVVFKDDNFSFKVNDSKHVIDVTDNSEQKSEIISTDCGSYSRDWEDEYPETLGFLDPILLPELNIVGDEVSYNSYLVPAFLLPTISYEIEEANTKEAILIGVDVATIAFGGVGVYSAIAKGAVRANRMTIALRSAQTVTAIASLGLRTSDSCQANNTCQKIATVVVILELISITPDLYSVTKNVLHKSIDAIVAATASTKYKRALRAGQNLEYLQRRINKLAITPSNIPEHMKTYINQCPVDASHPVLILNELSDDALKAIGSNVDQADFAIILDEIIADLHLSKSKNPKINGVVDFDNTDDLIDFLNSSPNAVKALNDLVIRNVSGILTTNTKFLSRLSDNPNLVNYIDNLTPAGKTILANNADEWIKIYDARVPLKNGNVSDAVNVLGGNLNSPQPHIGGNYVKALSTAQETKFSQIINSSTIDANIASNLGIDQSVIQVAKEHMFITEHLVETSTGGFVKGRFDVDLDQANWWTDVSSGNIITNPDGITTNADDLRKLIAHEFIESKLMQEGIIYSPFTSSSAAKYGAHQLSIHDFRFNFEHWASVLGRNVPSFTLNPNLSNIDDVVSQIKTIEGLK